MGKLLVILSLLTGIHSFAQDLGPLGFNPRLYYPAAKAHLIKPQNRVKDAVIVENGVQLIQTDTLNIPFSDDFTTNTLKPYDYDQYVIDTIYNTLGPCDTFLHVGTTFDTFSFYPTYVYYFDTAHQQVDSIANAPFVLHLYPGLSNACFDSLTDSIVVYPKGYTYAFDSTTGQILNENLDTSRGYSIITYTPALYVSRLPAYAKWIDNNAYQNYTSGYLPPTIGVVTLDGLTSYGQPYNNTSPTNEGYADVLTSKPINLSSLTEGDSTYLSFFYQGGGYGDIPSVGDSLVVEFLNNYTNNWDHVWSITGDTIADTVLAFQQVFIRVPGTISPYQNYYYNGFQFRFKNYGSLVGNNDVWNIDYVVLDTGRTVTDTFTRDLAFQYLFPSILKNYEQMPVWQFTGAADMADTIALPIFNLNTPQATGNPPATSYTIISNEVYPTPASLYNSTNNFNAGIEDSVYLYPSTQYAVPDTHGINNFDSLTIHSQASIITGNPNTANDTIRRDDVLYNTFAYDDGTAELTYGLHNLGILKFGYEFILNHPDTIVGYQVLFSNAIEDVSQLVFTYNMWFRIDTQNVYFIDTPVYTSNNATPYYIDSVNGFASFRMDPMAVPTRFFFGWSQDDVRNLQIGYDLNSTKGYSHMYVKANGAWSQSFVGIPGSPMIRVIMRHSNQIQSGIRTTYINPVKVYPNPTTGLVTFELPDADKSYMAELYNTLGQLSLKETIGTGINNIDMSHLGTGMYLLRLTDIQSGMTYQNKILRSPN